MHPPVLGVSQTSSVTGREAAPVSTLAVTVASLPRPALEHMRSYELQRDRANICIVKGANPHVNGSRRRALGRNLDLRLGVLVRSIM